jgi:FtsH-binding integral membrane protein
MSCSVSTLAGPPQSQSVSNVLGPGIAGLFIHGLVTGLVIAQFARWFSASKRDDSVAFTALIIFVTVVGLCVSFRAYVQITSLTIHRP